MLQKNWQKFATLCFESFFCKSSLFSKQKLLKNFCMSFRCWFLAIEASSFQVDLSFAIPTIRQESSHSSNKTGLGSEQLQMRCFVFRIKLLLLYFLFEY